MNESNKTTTIALYNSQEVQKKERVEKKLTEVTIYSTSGL